MKVFDEIRDRIFGFEGESQLLDQAQRRAAPEGGGRVDVEAVLEEIARERSDPALEWRSSVAGLMELLGLDASAERRRALAGELGLEDEFRDDRETDLWLYRRLMQELEAAGAKVPARLAH